MQVTAGRYFCEPPMKAKNSGVGSPDLSEKMFLPVLAVDHRLVDVHGRARLARHRFGHERRVHVVAKRSLADGALELEDLVGEYERIAVAQVDLHLRRAFLVDQRVDLELLLLGELVDVVEQIVELVDRGDRVGLARELGPARAPARRLQRVIRILVRLDQIKLDLRRHHRHPAAIGEEFDRPPQHLAWRDLQRPAIRMVGVMDELRRRIDFPRHHRQRREIRFEQHVAIGSVVLETLVILRPVAADRLGEDRARHRHGRPGQEFLHRHHLPARDARLIGDDALDVLDMSLCQPLPRFLKRGDAARPFRGGGLGFLLACHKVTCVAARQACGPRSRSK